MARHPDSHVISGCPALLLAPIAIPFILLVKLAERLFGLKTKADLTAKDVESYLNDFLHGRGGKWDFDDFTSIRITDRELDAIREEAAFVQMPLTDEGIETLRQLLARVRAM
jgi:hypothetical protein